MTFETIELSYILTLEADPQEAGTVEGAGKYAEGTAVNISATPAEGYSFVNWTGDNVDYPDFMTTTVTMPTDDLFLAANFQEIIGIWWTFTQRSRNMEPNTGNLRDFYYGKTYSFSLRCVKDND